MIIQDDMICVGEDAWHVWEQIALLCCNWLRDLIFHGFPTKAWMRRPFVLLFEPVVRVFVIQQINYIDRVYRTFIFFTTFSRLYSSGLRSIFMRKSGEQETSKGVARLLKWVNP